MNADVLSLRVGNPARFRSLTLLDRSGVQMAYQTVEASFVGDAPIAASAEALPDRRKLALVAVERTRMPMVVTDPRQADDPIVLANQAFLDLTGYTATEVIGRNCRFLQGPETAPPDVDAIRRGVASGEHHVDVELLNYRKDGTAFWNQLSISPVHGPTGDTLYYFASQKDITARRRAEALEATERLLLKEVDHRAMNALALVQSIVRLSRAEDIASYSASILGRIDALARAHRLLARSGWSQVAVDELIALEIASVPVGQVAVSGPTAQVPAMLVQPISLVLHELVANALKHGALAHPHGQLTVGWTSAPDRLTLSWGETGSPPRRQEPVAGFGLTMVRGVVERQLGGLFDPDWQDAGLNARIELPVTRPA